MGFATLRGGRGGCGIGGSRLGGLGGILLTALRGGSTLSGIVLGRLGVLGGLSSLAAGSQAQNQGHSQ